MTANYLLLLLLTLSYMAWSFDEQNDDHYFYHLDMAFLGRPSKLTKKELGLPAEQGCQ